MILPPASYSAAIERIRAITPRALAPDECRVTMGRIRAHLMDSIEHPPRPWRAPIMGERARRSMLPPEHRDPNPWTLFRYR